VFDGLWTRLYVTDHWVVIRSPLRDMPLRLADIESVLWGFDPSPHDSGGPPWGAWITTTSGNEHGIVLFHPGRAAALIASLRPAAQRDAAEEERQEADSPDFRGWARP
jgi:hypothetical protein